MSAYAGVTAERWRARPGLARACRVAAFAGPVAAVTVLAFIATRWLPALPGTMPTVARWAVIAVIALICAVLAERLLSRLLPIAALLDLDIGFPSGAPTRLRIASLASLRSRDADLADRLPGSAGHDLDAAAEYALIGYATRVRPGLQPRPHLERVRLLSMLVGARLGLSDEECDRLQWALLLRELGSHRPDERAPDHPLVAWLGPWAVLRHGPFVTVAQQAPSAAIATAAHAAAVSDAYAVVTASHPYRRGVGSGHAGRRLKTMSDPNLLPEAADALLTLPEARLRRALGFTAGLSPLVERYAPAPQPLMAATSIVVVLALAAAPVMRSDAGVDDRGARLTGLDAEAEAERARGSEPAGAPQAATPSERASRGADDDAEQDRDDDVTVSAGSQLDYTSAASPSRSSGTAGSGGTAKKPAKKATKPSAKPSTGTGTEPPSGGGSTPPPQEPPEEPEEPPEEPEEPEEPPEEPPPGGEDGPGASGDGSQTP